MNPGWDQRAAEDIIRAGNVPFDAKISTLSGGQRTRVAIALAFGKRPDLLLLDEPMSDLDPVVRHEIMGTLLAEAAALVSDATWGLLAGTARNCSRWGGVILFLLVR